MSEKARKGVVLENLFIALDVVRIHRLRSSLIILGVSIGIASLMGMVSLLSGLRESIRQDVQASEQATLMVDKFDFFVGGLDESVFRRKEISPEDADAIREDCPSLQHVTFFVQLQGRMPYTLHYGGEKSRMNTVFGTEPSMFQIWSLDLAEGRMFTREEMFHRAKVVVLGHSPRRDLFPVVDPIGKKMRIGNDDYTVIGTFADRKTLFGAMGENFALVPYTTYMANLWRENDMQRVIAAVRDGIPIETAQEEIVRVMRVRRKLKANEDNDFAVTTTDAALEFLDMITAPIAGVLAGISSIALLVGGIGVMNMMLVSVTERTGEIGIRKAVGATRQDILWQFLIEAGTLTGLGGVVGISLGYGAAQLVSSLTGLPSHLSLIYVCVAVLFSVGIGVFFGIYPANRASKLDPIEAMGYAK